tara:strand:- start:1579 stop:1962 length:384 start_codon:yes stop_codon:yes gene_type:complete
MASEHKEFYYKLLNNKEVLLRFVYVLQDKYANAIEENDNLKSSLKNKYKNFHEDEFNKWSRYIDEKERDLGILIRKTELLDDKIFRSFDDSSWNRSLRKDFLDLITVQRAYYSKWKSWNLSSVNCNG